MTYSTYNPSGALAAVATMSPSMAGIVSQAFNAKFYLEVYDGSLTTDSWGNQIPNPESTELLITAKLFQHTATELGKTDENPGDAIYRTSMTGYLVYPTTYDLPFPKKMKTQYLYNGNWRDCFFYPVNFLHTAIEEATTLYKAIGQKIEGTLEMIEGS